MTKEVISHRLTQLHLKFNTIVKTNQVITSINNLRTNVQQRKYLVKTKLFQTQSQLLLLSLALLEVITLLRLQLEMKRNSFNRVRTRF